MVNSSFNLLADLQPPLIPP